jgi:hypothetical protein
MGARSGKDSRFLDNSSSTPSRYSFVDFFHKIMSFIEFVCQLSIMMIVRFRVDFDSLSRKIQHNGKSYQNK